MSLTWTGNSIHLVEPDYAGMAEANRLYHDPITDLGPMLRRRGSKVLALWVLTITVLVVAAGFYFGVNR